MARLDNTVSQSARPFGRLNYSTIPFTPRSFLPAFSRCQNKDYTRNTVSVSACSPTSPCRTHPQPLLPRPPSPLVSAVQNVPLLWSSSNDFLYSLLGNSPPGARSLTRPNPPTMPFSTARAFAPIGLLSPLTARRFNPPLTFLNHLHRIVTLPPSRLLLTRFLTPTNPSTPRTNRESPMQNPWLPPRPPHQRLRTNPPIAGAPEACDSAHPQCFAPAPLSIGH